MGDFLSSRALAHEQGTALEKMIPKSKSVDPVLRRLAIGFSTIIVLCWVVEFARIPHRFFGEPNVFLWGRVLFRTFVLGGVWFWVHITSKRLLERLHHLEEFLLMCSWCRKIGHEGRWLTTEEYFGSNFKTSTSHGICPQCSLEHFDTIVGPAETRSKGGLSIACEPMEMPTAVPPQEFERARDLKTELN